MAKDQTNKEPKAQETIYYCPSLGKSVKASSMEEAVKKVKGEK